MAVSVEVPMACGGDDGVVVGHRCGSYIVCVPEDDDHDKHDRQGLMFMMLSMVMGILAWR